jgi:NAD(P)-dependent dehydrogenase (short-subunit alcohol dehydrogenase family)
MKEDTMKEQNDVPNEGITRQNFLKASAAMAGTSIALPSVLGNVFMVDAAKANTSGPRLDPRYYPLLAGFVQEIELQGKLAVITGASRGNGRATAEALIELGADVIGTSRDVAHVPNPPAYPLLDLDITKPASVRRFVAALTRKLRGRKVDILINNAGRLVLGNIIPATSSLDFYFKQLQLSTETLYLGHIRVTNALIPFMPTQGYARLLFTVSVAAYLVGGSDPHTSWGQGYTSAKRALLAYANSLRAALHYASSNILISTVNPYRIATALPEHPNPIYTEPVLDNGFTDDPPTATPFNQFLTFLRQGQAAGLPASFVGDAYAQLLRASEPPANVVVASAEEPFATQGANEVIEPIVLAENTESGLRFSCS